MNRGLVARLCCSRSSGRCRTPRWAGVIRPACELTGPGARSRARPAGPAERRIAAPPPADARRPEVTAREGRRARGCNVPGGCGQVRVSAPPSGRQPMTVNIQPGRADRRPRPACRPGPCHAPGPRWQIAGLRSAWPCACAVRWLRGPPAPDRQAAPAAGPAHGTGPVQILRRLNLPRCSAHLWRATPRQANERTAPVRLVSGRPPGARAAGRVLVAVTSAAMAAGVMAGTASTATASATRPAARTAAGVMQPAFGCQYGEIRPPDCFNEGR
jgi:hypothetical protein